MTRSEIDDIFAATKKGAPSQATSVASTSKAPEKKTQSQQKRKRKVAAESTLDEKQLSSQSAKRKAPETVLDPSVHVAAPLAKRVKGHKADRPAEVKKKTKADREEEQRFKDSRGTGPSMSLVTVTALYFLCNIFRRRAQNRGGVLDLQGGRARYHRPGWRCVNSVSRTVHLASSVVRYTALSF